MSGNKSEKPTPKRLRDARKKGDIFRSREIVSASTITAMFLMLILFGSFFMKHMSQIVSYPLDVQNKDMPFSVISQDLGISILKEMIIILLPIVIVVSVISVLSNGLQSGWNLSMHPVKPDLQKLNPATGLKNIFSVKNFVEILKSIFKVTALSLIIWLCVRDQINALFRLPVCGMECTLPVMGVILKDIFIYTAITFAAVAVFDFFFQKRQYMKKMMMSRDEIKKEFKDTEGDGLIKQKRTQLFREITSENLKSAVSESTVIVTNPTHIAVGLYYRAEETPLPTVKFKEQGEMALSIMAMAREQGKPMIQNIPLARGLLEKASIDEYIPSEFIEPVAEVIKWAIELTDKK
ncbi:MAG: type III secretion system export apparatus subunit SctU [Oligoflexales bacterium]|nr:type III secretion system export apparatus subunit SctU [Oligoflexales bacterium]